MKARLGLEATIRRAAEEDGVMNGIRRAIVVGVFITLGVLGTGWALERVSGGSPLQGGAALADPTEATNIAPVTGESPDGSVGM